MYSASKGIHLYRIKSDDSLQKIAQHYQITIQEITEINPEININNLDIGQNIRIPQRHSLYQTTVQSSSTKISKEEEMLNNHMRSLWEQHVYWTRMFIVSTAFGLPDIEFVTNRLLQNPKDFEAAFVPFYGKETAANFEKLFTEHITIAGELVNAAKAGDTAAAANAEKRWYENADQISMFLADINPHWSEKDWKKMFYSHLAMTKDEAVNILSKNYKNSIVLFDNIEKEALEMADMMTQGIVMQFPQYFS